MSTQYQDLLLKISSGETGASRDRRTLKQSVTKSLATVFGIVGENFVMGTGILISEGGLLLTAFHVYEGMELSSMRVSVFAENESFSVDEVIFEDIINDLVLLKVNYNKGENPSSVLFFPEEKESIDREIIALSYIAKKVQQKAGRIGKVFRNKEAFENPPIKDQRHPCSTFETSAQVVPGFSGGPVVCKETGFILGISSMFFPKGELCNQNSKHFCISSWVILQFFQKIAKK